MLCEICRVVLSKYKCPSCRVPYCSLPCWKTHKSSPCGSEGTGGQNSSVPATDSQSRLPYEFPTDDTVPIEKLQLLSGSQRLKDILSNPHVRTILSSVNSSSRPNDILRDAMQEPIFVEFVDECMRLLYPPSKEEIEAALLDQ